MAWDVPTCATLDAILKMKALNHMGGVWGQLTISVSLGTYSSVPTPEFFLLTDTLLVLTKQVRNQCPVKG